MSREGETGKGEDKGEEAEMEEMEESKDGGDLVLSSSDVVPAKTEADKVIVREEEEKVEDLSVHRQACSSHRQIVIWV